MTSAEALPASVLLVSADPFLVDQVLLVAASVGVHPQVVDLPSAAGVAWARSRLVLLGADVDVRTLVGTRDRVVLVGADHDPPGAPAAAAAGAERTLALPSGGEALARLLAAAVQAPEHGGTVLGVLGSRGGAGATTLAAALACGRDPALLVDGDPAGCGVQVALGCESAPGLRWPELEQLAGSLRPGVLAASLPLTDGIRVLSWQSSGERDQGLVPLGALQAVLAAARHEFALTVLDLPRRCDTAAVLRWRLLDEVVLLVPDEVPAALAGRHLARALKSTVADVHLVVRTRRKGGLGQAAVEDAVGRAALARWGDQPDLARAADDGDLLWRVRSGACARVARRVLERVDAGLSDPGWSGAA